MRKRIIHKAKLTVFVTGYKSDRSIKTDSVLDNRTGTYWTPEQIKERGIENFLNLSDMKETLNWNLNGDSSLFQFKWGQSKKTETEGIAFVFD